MAKGVAIMTQTEYTITDKVLYYEDLENSILIDLLEKNMKELGPIPFIEEKFDYLKKLSETFPPRAQKRTVDFYQIPENEMHKGVHTGIVHQDELIYLPSDDAGNVSVRAPFGTFLVAVPPVGMPMHC